MAKRIFNRRIMALVLVLVMGFSMFRVTAQAAPPANNWSYAYYLGQEYLGNAGGVAVKPDPVGYGFQGVITELTFTDDAGKSWTFVWSSEANGEWRITGGGVSEAKAKAWPQVTSGKTYTGFCKGTAYTFTLSDDGSAKEDWTYARNGHANWFRYIRFIRAYTVNVFYQNDTGSVIYNGEKFTAEAPLTNYFHFLYPDGGIIDDSEFEDGEYTEPTTLMPEQYLPQSMKDLGYEIKYATDAHGNDVLTSGVTISLLGENVLNVYCTLIPPKTEHYTVIHSYYTEGTHDGTHNGGSVEVEESADFAQVVDGITKETVYNGHTYDYIRYDVDAANKVITLTYSRELPTYNYSLTYNANFGGNETKSDSENVSGTKATSHAFGVDANTFTRDHYSFAGWNTAPDGSGTAYTPGDTLSLTAENNTATLYAQWIEDPKYSYSLIYNANFGTSPEVRSDEENVSGTYATTYNIAVNPNEFRRDNYTFTGWNTAADGSGTAYTADDKIHLTSQDNSRTLYAQWTENEKFDYAVTYHANFGADETKSDSENVSQTYALQHRVSVDVNGFVRENYTFTGWNTAADGSGTAYTAGQALNLTFDANTADLYAQWAENEKFDYSVIYNANFGENETKADSENILQTYAAEYAIEVDANEFTRPNHTFIGWSYSPDGSVDIHSGDSITFAGSGSITLYALWAEDDKYSYSLTYNGNGGQLADGSVSYGDSENIAETYDTEASMEVDSNAFIRENYTFTGWNTAADGTGTAYTAEEVLALTAEGNTATLYAQWEENEKYDYTVTYDPNYEGEDPITDPESEEQIYDTEHKIQVDENPFDREGYTFEGWATEPDGDVVYQPGDSIEMTEGGDVTLYAQWTIDVYDYTVIYMVRIDGGEYTRFEGQLPEGAPVGGTAEYGTHIDAEYLQGLPTALYDDPYAYEFSAIDEITVPFGTNTVLVYYTYYTPEPPAQAPQEQPQTGGEPQPQNEDDGLVDIPDEEVPLADVPKTSDPMMFYLGISALSGLGLLKLSRKKEDEEEA